MLHNKKCSKCRRYLDISDFYLRKRLTGVGHSSHCKKCIAIYRKKYISTLEYKKNFQDYMKKYSKTIKYKDYQKKYTSTEKFKEYKRTYQRSEKRRKYKTAYINKKKINDPEYKLRRKLRERVRNLFRKDRNQGSAVRNLGCTILELKNHLESQFKPGMNWHNHGQFGWHIDHIKPLSKFDLNNEEQFLKAVHYTNLQPLWWRDNIIKSNKI